MKADKAYAVAFSGGKDSTLALDRAIHMGLNIKYLVNIYNEETNRVRFHGFKKEIIKAQSDALGLELIQSGSTNENFEEIFLKGLKILKDKKVDGIIFGDIHLEDVKSWFEERTTKLGFEHVEPLWKNPQKTLITEMVNRGYKAIITNLDLEKTNENWLGKEVTKNLIQEFEKAEIDLCGENGEYHSFVSDGPLFNHPISFGLGLITKSKTHATIDIILDN